MLKTIRSLFHNLIRKRRRRIYCEGKTLSRFIARDVSREILILSAAEIDDGFLTVKMRTTNVMYLRRGLTTLQPFGEPKRVAIDKLWEWTGNSWGGLPDGTSIVDKLDSETSDTSNDT